MKRKKINGIRTIALSGALLASIVVSGLTQASALENIVASELGESQILLEDIQFGGLTVNPAELKPYDGTGFYKIPWVAIDDKYEGRYVDGLLTGRRNHDYKLISEEVKANKNKTHDNIANYECNSCGHDLSVTDTIACNFDEGVRKGNKITYTCETEGCGNTYTKTLGSSNSGSNKPSHTHSFGEWEYLDENLEASYCPADNTLMGTRNHSLKTNAEITSNNDGTHDVIRSEECTTCNYSKEPVLESNVACNFDTGVINEDETSITYTCLDCGYTKTEAYTHQHSDVPEDLVYAYNSSNNNGTHKLSASYECTKCGEEITLFKNEDCSYTTTYESVGITNPNNIHNVINTCDVCNYEAKTTESCTKTGDMQFIKIYSNIYQYYDCAVCHGYVDRDYHTEHVYGEWETDMTNHIRYCGCVEAREEGYHDFDKDTGSCKDCGYVLDHNHAPDNMGLTDLIFSEYYDQLDSKSNFTNPNPNPDEYCYRYDITCHTCRVPYRIEYDHHYDENGVCHRTDCKVIDPNYVPGTTYDNNIFENAEYSNSDVLKLERKLDRANY